MPNTRDPDYLVGFHQRLHAERDEWQVIEIYKAAGKYYWTYVDTSSQPKGSEEGPFETSQEAYHDAPIL